MMVTQEYKLKKLREIESEVKDFHPLLKDLFPKLPTVKKVDYTHGPNEMGADFIITQHDVALDSEEYIGVIVKCGNIRQDQDDIERQIRECSYPRKIDGGKKNIHLNEIWIVNNGVISENAKHKIHEEYKSKNIKFIWDERLIALFDKFFPEYWQDIDLSVGLYLSSLNRRVHELNTRQGIVELAHDDFYIEQDVIRYKSSETKSKFSLHKKATKEKLSSVLHKERFLLVEAGMGYGKSRLLRQAAIEYSSHSQYIESGILPIFLTFRDLVDLHKNSLEDLIRHIKEHEKIDPTNHSVLFVIDAVDEIKGDAVSKATTISSFVQQLMPHQKMGAVFASRPIEDPIADEIIEKCLARYHLLPLTAQKLVTFIEKVCKKSVITARFKNDLHNSDLFRSLPKTPISAILLGRVLNADVRELPSTLPELYSKYLELALGRWDLKKGHLSEKEYETTVILVRAFAQFMMQADVTEISLGDAKEIVRNYLTKRETGQTLDQLFINISSCSEIICIDEIKQTLFFRHRTFLEYMFAEGLFVEHGKGALLEDPFNLFWGTVNYFYLGKLKDCQQQLRNIFSIVPKDEAETIIKIFQGSSYLLAAYQSPYEEITECVRKVILEASDLYLRICENPSKFPISNLSEMQLLSVLTSLMRRSFEYEFFSRSLRNIETDVLLSIDNDKRKAIAGFFVAAIRAGLGVSNAFDALIDQHLSDLPFAIKLGITHASNDAGVTNATLKHFEKKINRVKQSNKALSNLTYNIPLNQRRDYQSS